jgi:hypothetical protein
MIWPRIHSLKHKATTMIITGPPMNSARVNCHPSTRAITTPNSMTRFVDAISNAMAAVRLAPLRKSDRAKATAAYEQDDDAAPNAVAAARDRGEASLISRPIRSRRTTA